VNDLLISFQGQAAEQHRLPAYEASQSLYGISRSLLIVTNYLSEGRVRRRDFEQVNRPYQINLVAQRAGSFEFLYEILTDPMARAVATKVAADLTVDFIRSIFRRSVGEKADAAIEDLEAQKQLDTGDLGALVEAIEPAMKVAHTVVDHGATNIILISGDNNVVNLNSATKQYVWTSIRDNKPRVKLFSIASYNANSRSGRAFDYELGKTVPFEVEPRADRETISAILSSMSYFDLMLVGEYLSYSIAVI
jgi:hypothetical protein